MENNQENKKYDGCPCGMQGQCCEKPDVSGNGHECDKKCENVCEENYQLICNNCGSSCYHEL